VQKSFQAWLRPGFGDFRLDYNADRLEALATERASEWARIGKASFLTLDEQREAVGYGPAPKDGVFAKWGGWFERRYSPNQPRAPAGSADGGQWTSGGGGNNQDKVPRLGSEWITIAGGFTPEQLDMTVQDFVSGYCAGSIASEIPGQLLSSLVREVLDQAKAGDAAARKCKKLLNEDRFRK
jgi:hypothetical protein